MNCERRWALANCAGSFAAPGIRATSRLWCEVMVFNRLCDPESKLGVLRWLETVALPDRPADITHQHLLRSMDALMEHRDAVDRVVARLLRPLIDQDLSVVFYDLTTIRAEGDSMQEGDVRRFGMAKEGVIARQFLLGVVQTAEGVPIYHEVFDGNVAETRTLLPTLATVLERFPSVRRLILVADRGLLSLDNLEALREIRLANGRALEFILAVPGRRYNEFLKELRAFHKTQCQDAQAEVITEQRWHDLRLIVAHDPATAAEQTGRRNERIAALIDQANAWADKLDAQDLGETRRGRPLSDRGATARLYHAVAEAHLSRIIKVDLKSPVLRYHIDWKARALAELMDGKLLLVTNATALTAPEVVDRYKALADIERGFRVLKSEIEIGPVYHRLPERIRAHAQICFMALILHRVMRASSALGPYRLVAGACAGAPDPYPASPHPGPDSVPCRVEACRTEAVSRVSWKPRCPRCGLPAPLRATQVVRCASCGALLEDDRVSNLKLYFVFILVVLVLSLFLPLYLVLAFLPVLLAILVRNMRFVEKSGQG
jgi:uncharacterized protein (DUF983 family)